MSRKRNGIGRSSLLKGMPGAAAAAPVAGQVHGWWVPEWQMPRA
jgi:hypothetical protein